MILSIVDGKTVASINANIKAGVISIVYNMNTDAYVPCVVMIDAHHASRRSLMNDSDLPDDIQKMFNFYKYTRDFNTYIAMSNDLTQTHAINNGVIVVVGVLNAGTKNIDLFKLVGNPAFHATFCTYIDASGNIRGGKTAEVIDIIKHQAEESKRALSRIRSSLKAVYDSRDSTFIITGNGLLPFYDTIFMFRFATTGKRRIRHTCINYNYENVYIPRNGDVQQSISLQSIIPERTGDLFFICFYFNGVPFGVFYVSNGIVTSLNNKIERFSYKKMLDVFTVSKPEVCGNEVTFEYSTLRKERYGQYYWDTIKKRIPRDDYERFINARIVLRSIGKMLKMRSPVLVAEPGSPRENRERRVLRNEMARLGVDILTFSIDPFSKSRYYNKPSVLETSFVDKDGVMFYVALKMDMEQDIAEKLANRKLPRVGERLESLPLIIREKHVQSIDVPRENEEFFLKQALYKMKYKDEFINAYVNDELISRYNAWRNANNIKFISPESARDFLNTLKPKKDIAGIRESLKEITKTSKIYKVQGAEKVIRAMRALSVDSSIVREKPLFEMLETKYGLGTTIDVHVKLVIDLGLVERKYMYETVRYPGREDYITERRAVYVLTEKGWNVNV